MKVNQQLVQYISQLVKQGYRYEAIRSNLVGSGWDPAVVDESYRFVYYQIQQKQQATNQATRQVTEQPTQQGRNQLGGSQRGSSEVVLKFSKSSIVVGVVSVFLIVVLSSFVMSLFGNGNDASSVSNPTDSLVPSQLLDYKLHIEGKNVEGDDDLKFINKLTNMGSDLRYDIILNYQITSRKTGDVVDEWSESKAISVVQEYSVMHGLLNLEPGVYTLKSLITYNEGKATASASDTFTVIDNAPVVVDSCADGIRNNGEVGIDCGGPCSPCAVYQPDNVGGNNSPSEVVDGNSGSGVIVEPTEQEISYNRNPRSQQEIMNELQILMNEDLNKAGEYCDSILDMARHDFCFKTIAHETGNKEFCSYIDSESSYDFCYMKFASSGDTSVCSLIKNSHMKMACEGLNFVNE